MDDIDAHVRLAAFSFLEEQTRLAPEEGALPRRVLELEFAYEGHRVLLMRPQGIFKPRLLREVPLSITTVPVVEGGTRPYDDAGAHCRRTATDEKRPAVVAADGRGAVKCEVVVPCAAAANARLRP